MKIIFEIFETFCILNWLITVILLFNIEDLVSLGKDQSPSNAVVVHLIISGFVATQVMIKWGIEKLGSEQ